MVYTVNDLKDLLKEPIQQDKWGPDTHKAISIIKNITDASCSSCAMRRYLGILKNILNKYGDDIPYTPNSYYVQRRDNSPRIPCVDCVAKHLSQAYVLQGEFYQGYTEYLALIEAHLNEALEECPPGNAELRKSIKDMIASVSVDRKPDISPVLYEEHPEDAPKPHNINDDMTGIQDTQDITEESFYSVPTPVLNYVHRMLDLNLRNVENPEGIVYRGSLPMVRFMGALAQAAEHISMYSPGAAVKLRELRLDLHRHTAHHEMEYVNNIIQECFSIKTMIKDAISRKNAQK